LGILRAFSGVRIGLVVAVAAVAIVVGFQAVGAASARRCSRHCPPVVRHHHHPFSRKPHKHHHGFTG
jgi:hypothetical protein